MNCSGPSVFANTLLLGLLLLSADGLSRDLQAQSLVDNSLGAEASVLNSQGLRDLVTGGAVRGSGLFHSFETLGVAEGRSLYFIQPEGISKILSRVTGNRPSNILGTLGVQKNGVQGDADLYLLNTNGILLGPNATLDLGGSFFASTADSLRLGGSDEEFDASSANPVPLLTLGVETGIQFGTNQPNRLLRNEAQLELQPMQGLVLDGGTLEQAGRIRAQGDVALRSESKIVIENAVVVSASPTSASSPAEIRPVNLTLTAQDDVLLRQPERGDSAYALLELRGNGGTLSVQAQNLTVQNTKAILTIAEGTGTGPALEVSLSEDLSLTQFSTVSTGSSAAQRAGDLTIQTGGSVVLEDSGVNTTLDFLGFQSLLPYDTGNLRIEAGKDIQLKSSFLVTESAANAGAIDLSARRIIVDGTDGKSVIVASGRLGTAGNGGPLTLRASESIELIGNQPGPFVIPEPEQFGLSAIVVESFNNTVIHNAALGSGQSNNIQVDTPRLSIKNGAGLVSVTGLLEDGLSPSGNVTVNANEIELVGLAGIASGTLGDKDGGRLQIQSDRIKLQDGAAIAVSAIFGEGNAGELRIKADELSVSGGSLITANTDGGGQGGLLDIVADRVTVQGSSADGLVPSALLADASATAKGRGGELRIRTNQLNVLEGGQIRASTRGAQDAGNLEIKAGQVLVSGTSIVNQPSSIEAQSTGAGAAGTLRVEADNVTIRDRAQATTASQFGDGGNILLSLDNFLLLRQQGRISATAGSANTLGDGGNISIDAGFVIAPPTENSDITADAFEGTGGNVTITTDGVFGIRPQVADTSKSDITASSELGIAGAIRIDRLADPPADTLARLPDRLLKPEDEIAQGCPSDKNARFVITGRGGLPANPQQRLLRNPVLEDWRERPPNPAIRTASKPSSAPRPGGRSLPREAQGLQRDRKGTIRLVLHQLQKQESDPVSTIAHCRGGQAG